MPSIATGAGPGPSIPAGRPAWRHAPVRLIHRPTLFAALAIGALLLGLAAAAAPLFVATSESELLTATIVDPVFTAYGAGITYRVTNVRFDERGPGGGSVTQERDRAFIAAAAESPALGPVSATFAAPQVRVAGPDGKDPPTGPIYGRLFAGSDVLRHVRILSGADGDGVWLPDQIADPTGTGPGDVVELNDGGSTVRVRVNGTFQAVYAAPPDGYWQPWSHEIYLRCPDCPLPPQFILADRHVLEDLQRALHRPIADEAWQAPVRATPQLTPQEARGLAGFADDLEASMQPGAGPLGEVFHCCGRFFTTGPFGASSESGFHNGMSDVVDILDQRAPGIRGPVDVLLLAGLIISLVAIAAGAAFVAASRRDESGLLMARGWSPGAVGARTALEAALPIMAGAVFGWALAYLSVRIFGPEGAMGTDALRAASWGAAAASVVAVLTVGLTSALMFASGHEHKGRAGRIASWFPWELLAFAGVWALGPLLHEGAGVAKVGGIDQPRPTVFLYPLLLALGFGILAARVALVLIARSARSGGSTRVSAGWLAVRRLASTGRLAAIFFVAAIMAVTVSLAAVGLVSSMRATVDAKAKVFVGSDVRVQAVTGATAPETFPLPITQVQRAPDAGSFDDDTGDRFDLLVVDPSTFEGAAFWSDSFSDRSLSDLMAALARGVGQRVPIVIADGQGHDPSSITLNQLAAPVEVVGRATSFPGASLHSPLVVMAADAIEPAFHVAPYRVSATSAATEFWIRGPADQALAAVADGDLQAFFVVTADGVKNIPLVVAAVNTLQVIEVLGLVALLLVLVLVVVYLQARQRSRVVAAALSERMGISPRLLRLALVVELAIVLTVAGLVGGAVGTLAIPVLLDAIEPLPLVPPPPVLVVPWAVLVGVGVLLMASAWLGGAIADRAVRRIELTEVMRVAG